MNKAARAGQDLFDYAYPGGYSDTPTQGAPLATARLERYDVVALVLDGKRFAEDTMVIALGITLRGEKVLYCIKAK